MIVTAGRLRSGNTSTGRCGSVNRPKTTNAPLRPSTRTRLRSDCVTRIVNINDAAFLADLVDQLGALGHDALAVLDAGPHQDPLAVERLNPYRAVGKPFR